jgi:EAL domain-containing protein (putative c-di-GMP-specific phosphodiesterase class I)
MLERVIADLKCWTEVGLDVRRVAVNASNVELRSGNYAERIIALLAASEVDPHHLEIEVTETAAFDDSLGVINHNLNTLAAHGVSIALDDFGTGFASLTHLKSLPVTKVKIDRSFVCNIVADVGCRSIIDAIVRLSHGLGKSVVAEGVEDEDQLARLRTRGRSPSIPSRSFCCAARRRRPCRRRRPARFQPSAPTRNCDWCPLRRPLTIAADGRSAPGLQVRRLAPRPLPLG